jgi:hypothetical protein
MSDELKFPGTRGTPDGDSISAPLRQLVRDAYAPPAANAEAYWATLEQRIMARVKSPGALETRWWTVLGPWAQAGLIAATAIFAVTSVINRRISESEMQSAYETALQSPTPEVDASAALLTPDRASARDATLDYVLSH